MYRWILAVTSIRACGLLMLIIGTYGIFLCGTSEKKNNGARCTVYYCMIYRRRYTGTECASIADSSLCILRGLLSGFEWLLVVTSIAALQIECAPSFLSVCQPHVSYIYTAASAFSSTVSSPFFLFPSRREGEHCFFHAVL